MDSNKDPSSLLHNDEKEILSLIHISRFMFQKAGVKLTPYTPSGRKAELEL